MAVGEESLDKMKKPPIQQILGTKSYNRSLHHIGDSLNPYEQAISIIGKTLAAFDEDYLTPFYGFEDEATHDQEVFSFFPDERICNGFEEVLSRCREIVPHLRLAGPDQHILPLLLKWP
ncbi:E3 ubiquitin-protein ligase RGLG1-like [Rhododendron vialii]|uniref:E3 ubiquitin-protein ligase RGLG1-like n=1 Tax=Rhododendron vialii TaxID=182163 RepID=UPI00265FED29|nr:E3 ubiquitin-protein ligase RGLG1-like [Rhododendron vialii]